MSLHRGDLRAVGLDQFLVVLQIQLGVLEKLLEVFNIRFDVGLVLASGTGLDVIGDQGLISTSH